jgi:hypothetical protein
MRLEGELEGEKGAAAALGGDELEERLELAAVAGEAVAVAVQQFSDLLDRGEKPASKLLTPDGGLPLGEETGDDVILRGYD